MKLVFDDEFDRFSKYVGPDGKGDCAPGGVGTWHTTLSYCARTHPAKDRFGQPIALGEEEIYTDSAFLGPKGNQFPQSLAVDPFSIVNGSLAIEASPASRAITAVSGAAYTSGVITTQYSFSQTYGYFEARMKLPAGKGLWPAFWLVPANGPRPPEIDILEAFATPNDHGSGGPTEIHYASTDRIDKLSRQAVSDVCKGWRDIGKDITSDFHTYGADVEPTGVVFYFDRQAYASCPPNSAVNGPLFMIINLAVGGDWPGYPNASNVWPAKLYIDYVRAYRK